MARKGEKNGADSSVFSPRWGKNNKTVVSLKGHFDAFCQQLQHLSDIMISTNSDLPGVKITFRFGSVTLIKVLPMKDKAQQNRAGRIRIATASPPSRHGIYSFHSRFSPRSFYSVCGIRWRNPTIVFGLLR